MERTPALLTLGLVSLALGCRGVDVVPVTDTLKAGASLGLAGAAAMTAIAGEGPSCVSMTPSCTSAPCAARVEVSLGEACPLALGAGEGTIVLDGDWTDEDTATFVPDLTSVSLGAGGEEVALALGVVVVQRDGDEVRVVFGEQGVVTDGADGGSADVDQAGFTVEVSLAGTPAEPSDDALELSGGGQRVRGSDVSQLALAGVVTDPSCRDNPVAGTATMAGAGEREASTTTLEFHEDCDGEVGVLASTEDPSYIGRSVALGL